MPTMELAIAELPQKDYALVAIFSDEDCFMAYIPVLLKMRRVPILIMNTVYFQYPEHQQSEHLDVVRHTMEEIVQSYEQRLEASQKTLFMHRDIQMHTDHPRVLASGNPVALSSTQFKILQLLLSNAGSTISIETIYTFAFGAAVISDNIENSIRCHINRIRKALLLATGKTDYILTDRGFGYRLI